MLRCTPKSLDTLKTYTNFTISNGYYYHCWWIECFGKGECILNGRELN